MDQRSPAPVKDGHVGIEALVRRAGNAQFTDEYKCKLRRLYPWPGIVETKRNITEFGAIWVVLDGGRIVDEHDHDEEETFIVVSGRARLIVGQEETELGTGDVAYIPRHARHQLTNLSPTEPFVMIDIYWDMGGRSGSISDMRAAP